MTLGGGVTALANLEPLANHAVYDVAPLSFATSANLFNLLDAFHSLFDSDRLGLGSIWLVPIKALTLCSKVDALLILQATLIQSASQVRWSLRFMEGRGSLLEAKNGSLCF